MLQLEYWIWIALGGIVILMLLSKSVRKPLQYLWYGILYSATGAIILFLINLVGKNFGFEFAINPITGFIVGFLGLPGMGYLAVVEGFLLH